MNLHLKSRLRTLLISSCFITVSILPIHGVPAYPGAMEITQPDGTTISVFLTGTERMHFYKTIDGILLAETAEGFFEYATLDGEGNLKSSGIRASDKWNRTPAENAFLAKIDTRQMLQTLEKKRVEALPARYSATGRMATDFEPAMPANPIPGLFSQENPFPTKGSPKILVLLVNYADVHFTSNPQHFHDMINKPDYKENSYYGSAIDYYSQQSKGQFTPQFDVYGPVNLPNTQYYYGGNDASGNDMRPREMVIDALKLLDDKVDFSQYDNNGDGVVDNVYVFYAGRGEASGGGANTVWPHSWNLASMSPTLDGVTFDSYACSNEINYDLNPAAIGTFCHEFGHVLGLPDLYATAYTEAQDPGSFDLMASGSYNNNSRTPPNLSSFERGALGWLEPEWLHYTGDYVMDSEIFKSNHAYLVATDKPTEFFLFENRCNGFKGWDEFILSSGLLVWHIDYDERVWDYNIVNNDPDHMYVDIVEAHGHKGYPPSASDCFPQGGKYEFGFNTTPALKSWDGKNLGIHIFDIKDYLEFDEDKPEDYLEFKVTGLTSIERITLPDNYYTIDGNRINAVESLVIYTASGLKAATVGAGQSLSLPSGFYIVVAGGKSTRINI